MLNQKRKLKLMIKHGGNVNEAAIKFGIAKEEWLDLSTGLNPHPWELNTPIPESYYQKLPHPDAAFYSFASRYYKSNNLLAVPGSQAAIQSIPRLLNNKKVALPVPGYEEHLHHWQQNNHDCITYDPDSVNLAGWVKLHKPDVVIVINPNNPSCRLYNKQELLSVLTFLEQKNGLLIVDEAFLDTYSDKSLLEIESDNLIVLRSLGKFFGLPGIRVGFVKASKHWRELIEDYLGSWAMNGPSLWISTQCLSDFDWQQDTYKQLKSLSIQQAQFLQEIFAGNDLSVTDYFMSVRMSIEMAQDIHTFYGKRGILVRLINLSNANLPYEAIIRFGLCPDDGVSYFQTVSRELNQYLRLNSAPKLSQQL